MLTWKLEDMVSTPLVWFMQLVVLGPFNVPSNPFVKQGFETLLSWNWDPRRDSLNLPKLCWVLHQDYLDTPVTRDWQCDIIVGHKGIDHCQGWFLCLPKCIEKKTVKVKLCGIISYLLLGKPWEEFLGLSSICLCVLLVFNILTLNDMKCFLT